MEPPRRHRLTRALAAAVVLGCLGGAAPALGAGDPLVKDQWVYGQSDPIGARAAWTQSGGAGVTVAVLDSGVQIDHPDLAANIWTNPGEVPANGVDDDGNGFVDDVHGASTLTGDGDVTDAGGHGTAIAGLIAARKGNGIGITGLAPEARIMPVKVMGAGAGGDLGSLSRGIRYAAAMGAKVISVSINSPYDSPLLTEALAFADSRGATVVASAGNAGTDIDARPSYPVSLPSPAILGVAATSEDGDLLATSNYGRRSVDLAAPGSMLMSTALRGGYAVVGGTSMAVPYVSGSLALLASRRPDLTSAQLRDALLRSADRRLAGRVAAGGLDVGAAMQRISPETLTASTRTAAAARLRLRSSKTTRAGRSASVRWTATNAGSVRRWTVKLDGRRVRSVRGGQPRLARKKVTRAGSHRWTVVGTTATGRQVVSSSRSFRVVR